MAYTFREIEAKWQQYWKDNQTFAAQDPDAKNFKENPKYFVWFYIFIRHKRGFRPWRNNEYFRRCRVFQHMKDKMRACIAKNRLIPTLFVSNRKYI